MDNLIGFEIFKIYIEANNEFKIPTDGLFIFSIYHGGVVAQNYFGLFSTSGWKPEDHYRKIESLVPEYNDSAVSFSYNPFTKTIKNNTPYPRRIVLLKINDYVD